MFRKGQSIRKADNKIYIAFYIVVAVAVVNALISSVTLSRNQQTISNLVKITNPSLSELSRLNLLITRSVMLSTNWVYLPNSGNNKDSLRYLNGVEFYSVRGRLQGLMSKWESEADREMMESIFYRYENLIRQEERIMLLLGNFDAYRDPAIRFAAEEILEKDIVDGAEAIVGDLRKIISSQTEVAMAQQDTMLYQFNGLIVLIVGFALAIVLCILAASFLISRSIIRPLLKVRALLIELSRGELPDFQLRLPKNAVGEMLGALQLLVSSLRSTSRFAEEIGNGNLDYSFNPLSEKDVQGKALLNMRERLKVAADEEARRRWISEGMAEMNEVIRQAGDDLNVLMDRMVSTLVERLNVQQAAIFLLQNTDSSDLHIQLGAHFALNNKILNSKRYELKQGMIGQAMASNKIIELDQSEDPYFTIDSGLGASKICALVIVPLTSSGKVVGAIEVASLYPLSKEKKDLLFGLSEAMGAGLFRVRASLITSQLLISSQKQAEELAQQEQELRKINAEITRQSHLLQRSEEELLQLNKELRENTTQLEERNLEIEDARLSLEFKAEQLELSNQYKSSFLANMSHELRTPLNSILILAKLLADNRKNNLDSKQLQHINVIHKSGTDLLALISDILDLSKIEAGKTILQNECFGLDELFDEMKLLFTEMANEKSILLTVVRPEARWEFCSDRQKVAQVLKNLLSNALKFTASGGTIALRVNEEFHEDDSRIVIEVCDSGIGIPAEKQGLIFEAFQQADSSTSRKFGGTGLGLSISREFVRLMGGEIQLESKEGEGSIFRVILPAQSKGLVPSDSRQVLRYIPDDDKKMWNPGDRTLLLIEDDPVFARMIIGQGRKAGYKVIVAINGEKGLAYAERYSPSVIFLDMRLPVMDGWTVLQKLQERESLASIPVYVLSAAGHPERSREMGAVMHLSKPLDQNEVAELLAEIELVSDQPALESRILLLGSIREELRREILSQIPHDRLTMSNSWEEYTRSGLNVQLSCIVGSRSLEGDVPAELPASVRFIYDENSPDECLRQIMDTVSVSDGLVKSDSMSGRPFEGIKVIIVDDDMRNIYSLSNILEAEGIRIISAFNGKEAIQSWMENKDTAFVLMDLMMPEMDGCEAIRAIRSLPGASHLPIIAITARTSSEDESRCREAGADAFITKPFTPANLLQVMKDLFSRQQHDHH